MALINLNKRVTDKWEVRCDNLESPDSFIYIKDRANEKVANPASMEIEVGDVYILPRNGQQYKIPEEGLSIDPKQSVVIYSRQKISLPYNAFGLITGKGNYIFQGCFISSGKIDPGFDGFLKIGFYNGSNKQILLKKGIGFASVFFINTDFTMSSSLEDYQTAPPVNTQKISRHTILWNYICAHWIQFVAWACIAIPTALLYIAQLIKLLKE